MRPLFKDAAAVISENHVVGHANRKVAGYGALFMVISTLSGTTKHESFG
jgi:hypothetical protein